ncbi:hypothetical protein MNAN1_001611 [Malassezia nana]|uniref:RRM domain-containing protein n=1 Tax=Malassezia nana TaxID=180528 RepID=A0AAF0ELN0_9BASI|nr:hypothetical protein MNAN1_001611 [Malassezia nana]
MPSHEACSATPPTAVYVYGLTERVQERHLEDIFGRYGALVRLCLHRAPARPWARLELDSEEAADRAITHMDQGQIDGAHVTVTLHARPELAVREPRASRMPRTWGPDATPSRERAAYAPVDRGWPASTDRGSSDSPV